jgi:transcriptional regulator with XRE-family HTH domain
MAGKYPPNRLLSWERLQRGWSYEELAERIRAQMRREGDVDTGLTANTVRRWENGDRWPEPRFRKHLVVLFRKPASELGLLTADELRMRPASDLVAEIRRLFAMADGEMRAGGLDRATFLRGLVGAGALPLFVRVMGDQAYVQAAASTVSSTVDAYARIVVGQRDLYWTSPARDLFESAYTHAHLGIRLLRSVSDDQTRTRFASGVAESAMLAGRLAFFDLRRPAVAQRCYDAALVATRDAGDHALAAAVLGHMAFVPAFTGESARALELIDAAHQHCWHGVSPIVRSWLHCVAAEAIGRSADPAGYRHRVGLAEESVSTDEPVPAWFDFYDASRLDGFAGYCALAAGDEGTAAGRLQDAVDRLAPGAVKQRPVLLADLATAYRSEPAHAADLLDGALDVLSLNWYATGHERIGDVIATLPTSTDKARLSDRHLALTAGL